MPLLAVLALSLAMLPQELEKPRRGTGALHIDGIKVVDEAGQPFRFMGINVPSLEWTAAGEHVDKSIATALDDWHANAIRLPMSQDRWFGKAPDSKDDGTAYRSLIDQAVAEASERHAYILLDLHWSDGGVWGQDIGQHTLPDLHSISFWRECAKRYANKPYVLFDLYNEPIDAPWKVWRDGGPVAETFQGKKLAYDAVGLQQLLDVVRNAGAKNLVVAGGLGYSSRLDGFPQYKLSDPNGNGVLYANHFYPGWESVENWQKRIAPYKTQLPLVVSEFGGSPQSLPLDDPKRRVAQVLNSLEESSTSWIAWCMHPAAEPCVISDWGYTPTPYFGALVKARLAGQTVSIPTRGAVHLPNGIVYDDKLGSQWQSWGNAKVDFSNKDTAHSGSSSMRVDLSSGQQLQLGVVPFDGYNFDHLSLWVNGGQGGGQNLQILLNIMDEGQPPVDLPPLAANQWTHVDLSLSKLGVADKENVKSLVIFAKGHAAAPTFYVDDVVFVSKKSN